MAGLSGLTQGDSENTSVKVYTIPSGAELFAQPEAGLDGERDNRPMFSRENLFQAGNLTVGQEAEASARFGEEGDAFHGIDGQQTFRDGEIEQAPEGGKVSVDRWLRPLPPVQHLRLNLAQLIGRNLSEKTAPEELRPEAPVANHIPKAL